MKRCARCRLEKDETAFTKCKQKKDGLSVYCRVCKSLDAKKYNVENREKCAEKLRRWREKNPEKNNEYARTYRDKNYDLIRARGATKESKEKMSAAVKRWQESNKERFRNSVKEWKKRNRIKTNAHSLVSKHISRGKLVRPKRCQRCRTDKGMIEAHHPDYSKPLEVQWLCKACHMKQHKED